MGDVDFSKILPEEAVKTIEQMRAEDMRRYTDPATDKLKEEISVHINSCPGCGTGSEAAKHLFKKEAFDFWQCNECELVYVNPQLDDENTTHLYREGRCMYQNKNLYLPTAEYRAETIYPRKLKSVEDLLGKKGTLLDFGSSTGYFMKTASKAGWNTFGVELNPFGVEWATTKLGLDNVFNDYLEKCPFEENQFDAITLWDVLEHLPDPFPILQQLQKLLNPGGVLVIETSHYDCLETELLGKDNTNIVGDMHILYFNKKSLSALLARSGFEVINFNIFGLDLKHIVSYDQYFGNGEFNIPEQAISVLQGYVDKAEKGCYIMVSARKCSD